MARVILGPGIFFASCAAEDGLAWTLLDTRDMDETRVRLQAGSPRALPESIRFSYPDPAEDTFKVTTSTKLKRLRKERARRWEPFLRDLPAALQKSLPLAGGRAPLWLRLLHQPPGPATPWLLPLVTGLDDKDLLQADPETLPRDIELAVDAREASAKAGLSYDDETFTRFVLSPRLHLEPWSPWRAQLHPWLKKSIALPLDRKMQAIRKDIDNISILPQTLFGPPLTPLQTLQGGFASSNSDKVVLATAALRTMGVPARCEVDFGGVEYFDGADWQFWEMQTATPASGALHVTGGKDVHPLQDFGVARIEDGHLRALDDLPWKETRGVQACAMQPGNYLLLEPERENDGVLVRLIPFSVTDKETTVVQIGAQ